MIADPNELRWMHLGQGQILTLILTLFSTALIASITEQFDFLPPPTLYTSPYLGFL